MFGHGHLKLNDIPKGLSLRCSNLVNLGNPKTLILCILTSCGLRNSLYLLQKNCLWWGMRATLFCQDSYLEYSGNLYWFKNMVIVGSSLRAMTSWGYGQLGTFAVPEINSFLLSCPIRHLLVTCRIRVPRLRHWGDLFRSVIVALPSLYRWLGLLIVFMPLEACITLSNILRDDLGGGFHTAVRKTKLGKWQVSEWNWKMLYWMS